MNLKVLTKSTVTPSFTYLLIHIQYNQAMNVSSRLEPKLSPLFQATKYTDVSFCHGKQLLEEKIKNPSYLKSL